MSLMSAISARGQMRDQRERGVNATVFIEVSQAHDDRCQAAHVFDHRSGPGSHCQEDQSLYREPEWQTAAVLSSTLFTPDELVWKHFKADTVGRMAITDKADLKAKVSRIPAPIAERSRKNPILLPNAIAQICRLNEFTYRLINKSPGFRDRPRPE
jgi:hypothetical protein